MRVLITNLYIHNYSGSEINVLEFSRFFKDKGYEVDVFCFYKGEPLLKHFEELQIPVYLDLEDVKGEKYDLVWVQHYSVFNLLVSGGIEYEKAIFSSLSPFESFEFPPVYANKMSLCLANSMETREQLIQNYVNADNILVFPNSVDLNYFSFQKSKAEFSKVICVSNHPPEELELIKREPDLPFEIDFFGISSGNYELIDPEKLKQYDAVISIGKTVQYAMSLGVPVFCYDHFGGPGWILDENIDKAFEKNFSGRDFGKKTSIQIIQELKELYPVARNYTEAARQFVEENCSLEKNMSKVFDLAVLPEKLTVTELGVPPFLFARVIKEKSELTAYYSDLHSTAKELDQIKSKIEILTQREKDLEQEVESLKNSISWKITKPIRGVKGLIGKSE